MENSIFERPYLGRHNDIPIYLNNGKFSPYLNYDGKLYSISKCFQNEKFNLKTAIKIITYNEEKFKKMKEVEDKFDKKLNSVDEEIKEVKGCEKDELDTKPKNDKKEKISK
jgi:topoisomerase IA-like protein